MKRFLTGSLALLVLCMGTVQAEENQLCYQHGEQARQTMRFRQSGGTQDELYKIVESETGRAIIDMAYARAVVPKASRAKSIDEFANHVKKSCNEIRESQKKRVAGIST
jgi:hypothetical protein